MLSHIESNWQQHCDQDLQAAILPMRGIRTASEGVLKRSNLALLVCLAEHHDCLIGPHLNFSPPAARAFAS